MENIIVIIRDTFPTTGVLNKKNLENKYILNPYDEYSLFEALKLKQTLDINIICIFLSNDKSSYGLRTALALGADEGIFINCNPKDELEIANTIGSIIASIDFRYIFVGIRDVNDDREGLPSYLSFKLCVALYSYVISISKNTDNIEIQVERDNTIDTIRIEDKSILAFSKNNYEPHYPSIKNILSIKNKKMSIYPYIEEEKVYNIVFQDTNRKCELYKKISSEKGAEKIIEYMKNWRIIE